MDTNINEKLSKLDLVFEYLSSKKYKFVTLTALALNLIKRFKYEEKNIHN